MELEILGMNFGCILQSLGNWSFPSRDCIVPLMAKVLGYCIVAGSTSVKVPQIIKILRSGSVRGLSVMSFELEVVGYTIGLAYCVNKGIPFSAYGEYFFLVLQSIVLIAIIYYYSTPLGAITLAKIMFYCALAPSVFAGRIDPALFEALFVSFVLLSAIHAYSYFSAIQAYNYVQQGAGQHVIFFSARVPQIWENHTNKSTGELSFLTCFMNFGGSLVRVFTSIEENAPGNMILGSLMGILLNGIILAQILLYRGKAHVHVAKDKKSE